MKEDARIIVEIPPQFRQKLRTALTAEGLNLTSWIKEEGEKKIKGYEDKLRKELSK